MSLGCSYLALTASTMSSAWWNRNATARSREERQRSPTLRVSQSIVYQRLAIERELGFYLYRRDRMNVNHVHASVQLPSPLLLCHRTVETGASVDSFQRPVVVVETVIHVKRQLNSGVDPTMSTTRHEYSRYHLPFTFFNSSVTDI